MLQDSEYPTYVPVGICSLIQCEYRYCFIRKMCNSVFPLLPSAPESDLAGDSGRQFNTGGISCQECNSEFHIFPDCPCRYNGGYDGVIPGTKSNYTSNSNSNNGGRVSEYRPPGTNSNSDSTSNSNSNSNSNLNSNPTGNLATSSIWKYIHPSDQYQVIEVNGVTFKFCANCRCNCTGGLGLYNRSHTTYKHRGPKLSTPDHAPSASEKMRHLKTILHPNMMYLLHCIF